MTPRKRRSERSGRSPIHSPGRPPVALREDRRQFWTSIAVGRSSEDSALLAGVSPAVGARWSVRRAACHHRICSLSSMKAPSLGQRARN